MSIYFSVLFAVCIAVEAAQARCDDDRALPDKLQTALNECQNDLESLITRGFFNDVVQAIQIGKQVQERSKKEAAYPRRQEIAGCMLLCMFRKLKIVDEEEIPTIEGLIEHLGEGTTKERGYFLAMSQAVQQCVTTGKSQPKSSDSDTHKCLISYRIFDCVRGQIMDYCQRT